MQYCIQSLILWIFLIFSKIWFRHTDLNYFNRATDLATFVIWKLIAFLFMIWGISPKL